MSGIVGIDPGVVRMGLAHVERGRWRDSRTVKGATGCAADWGKLARTVAAQAEVAVAYVVEREPDAVAIETMVDQRGRKGHSHKHTTAAACQAVYAALAVRGLDDLIVWQDASDVLDHKRGYGDLAYLLRMGRGGVGAPHDLDEHQASAVTHAVYCETVRHAPMAGLRP